MENAASFAGEVVDGRFPLRRYLGGGVRSAIFLTEYEDARAAIKFVPASAAQFTTWEAAGQLKHPALQRIFVGGEHRLGPTDCAYIVTEYADDNLAQLLSERHLTPAEARDITLAASEALAFLHAHGWVHGHVTPSNILGIGDRIVLSADNITQTTEGSAADWRALGNLLRQGIPSLPAPFLEIVQQATDSGTDSQGTAAMIDNRLRGGPVTPEKSAPAHRTPTQRRPTPGIWLGAAAVLVAAAGVYSYSRGSSAAIPSVSTASPKPAPINTPAPRPAVSAGVVNEVLPEIPQRALDTITGRVRINVKVTADRTGNVTDVVLQPPKGSKYFSERIITAAGRWQFSPSRAPQDWDLRFELRHDGVKASAARVRE